jgi:Fe-S-cluster-containing dehydrogenase component
MEKKKNGATEELRQKTDVGRRNFLASSAVLGVGVPLASLVNSRIAQAAAAKQATPEAPAAVSAPKAKSLLVERRRCTGCNSCVFACSLFHDGVVRPATARLHVLRHQSVVDVPVICWHCPDAPCVQACPATPKVIARDPETNVVKCVDEKNCLGAAKCGSCIAACPPEFLRPHPDTDLPMFCDLCDGDPQCVKACDRQSKETGQTLRSDHQIGGLHASYREVTVQDAINGLMVNIYYPNLDGTRR